MDDVLIVGAGPAGLAAALQCSRAGLSVRVFEQNRPGGLLWNANLVENYPGFPGGISGPGLVNRFLKQVSASGVEITPGRVTSLDWQTDSFEAVTPSGAYSAKTVILAPGTRPRLLETPAIPSEIASFVVYQIADLPPGLSKQRIIIIGSGDAAFDYAMNLGVSNTVTILNRGNTIRCLPLLWQRATKCANIHHVPLAVLKQIEPRGKELCITYSREGELSRLTADYLLVAIGREPDLRFLSQNLLQTLPDLEKSGLYHLAGDAKNGMFRQVSIAVGDGIRAAMTVSNTLLEKKR
jgi:thioredoxin reductase (NADPH)